MALLIFWNNLILLIYGFRYTIVSVVEIICNTHIKRKVNNFILSSDVMGTKATDEKLYEIEQILLMGLFSQYFAISNIYKFHI